MHVQIRDSFLKTTCLCDDRHVRGRLLRHIQHMPAGISADKRRLSALPERITPEVAAVAAKNGCPVFRLAEPLPQKGLLDKLASAVGFTKAVYDILSAGSKDCLEREKKILAGKPYAQGTSRFPADLIVGSAELAKTILSRDQDFPSGFAALNAMCGPECIISVSGSKHAQIRGLMAPFFAADEIEKYTSGVQKLAEKYLDYLADQSSGISNPADGPKALRLAELFTLEVITRYVAGLKISDEELKELKGDFQTMVTGYFSGLPVDNAWAAASWTPLGKGVAARQRIVARIENWIAAAQQQHAAGKPPAGVLDELVGHTDAGGQQLTHGELRDNMLGIMFGGYDTTASAITSMIYYLHHNPHWVEKLTEEQRQVVEQFGPKIDSKSLRSMKAAERFFRETMRLKPVVGGLGRAAKHDMQVGDFVLRKGDIVNIALRYIAAVDPQWEGRDGEFAPDVFNPDRWLEPNAGNQIPFGHGKHSCIGMSLALMEAKTMLAVLVRGYKVVDVAEPDEWWYTPVSERNNALPVLLSRK